MSDNGCHYDLSDMPTKDDPKLDLRLTVDLDRRLAAVAAFRRVTKSRAARDALDEVLPEAGALEPRRPAVCQLRRGRLIGLKVEL